MKADKLQILAGPLRGSGNVYNSAGPGAGPIQWSRYGREFALLALQGMEVARLLGINIFQRCLLRPCMRLNCILEFSTHMRGYVGFINSIRASVRILLCTWRAELMNG